MRTDEIAPRVALTQTESARKKTWFISNPAFGAVFLGVIAGLFAESAFQSYRAGLSFREWWREVLSATVWFGMALSGVVRGLNKARR